MKKNTFSILLVLVASFFFNQVSAQDGYTYSLIHNTGYSFSIEAVPNASANNFATSVQSYGFTIILPDGITIDTAGATSLGSAANATLFDGTAVGDPTIDGYLVTETLGAPVSLPAPSAATNSTVYTFTVNGSPITGSIYILENNSALATSITPLKSFMQADMIDNGMAEFVNVVDQNAAAVTAPSSFNFNVLSSDSFEMDLSNVTVYPNPSSDSFSVSGLTSNAVISLFSVSGKKILSVEDYAGEAIDVANLSSGLYLVSIESDGSKEVRRLIVQ